MARPIDDLPEGRPADDASNSVAYLKLPPHSIAAEQALLGAAMLRPEWLSTLTLAEEDFYRRDHRQLWRALLTLHRAGHAVDPVTVMEWADARGIDGLGAYAVEIANATPSAAHAPTYAATVTAMALRRQLIDAAQVATQAAYDETTPLATTTHGAMGALSAILSRTTPDPSVTEPVNLWGQIAPPSLPQGVLPPMIEAYAIERARLIGTHPAIVAMSCLVACASVTHDAIQLQPMRHNTQYLESARLWGLIVGDPSVKKTPAIGAAVGHLRAMDAADAEANRAKDADYDRALKVYKKAESAYIKSEAAGAYSGQPPEAPERPKRHRIVLMDSTVEAMSDILTDNDGGMLFYKDEISGWFGGMDAYRRSGGMDRALWLEAYQGGRRVVDRVSRGSIVVPNWSVCLIGGVQPDKIAGIVNQSDDDGLLARFMPLVVGQDQYPAIDASPDPDIVRRYHDTLEALRDTKPSASGHPVTYTDGAYDRWRAVTAWAAERMQWRLLPSGLRNHLGKWEGLFSRLCLAYHAIGCAQRGWYPTAQPIADQTAARVQAFMQGFLFDHARAFYGDVLGKSEETLLVEAIADYILAHGLTRVSRRDITRNVNTYRQAHAYLQNRSVEYLIDAAWLVPESMIERQPKSFMVNPRVHENFTTRAMEAKAKRRAQYEHLNKKDTTLNDS